MIARQRHTPIPMTTVTPSGEERVRPVADLARDGAKRGGAASSGRPPLESGGVSALDLLAARGADERRDRRPERESIVAPPDEADWCAPPSPDDLAERPEPLSLVVEPAAAEAPNNSPAVTVRPAAPERALLPGDPEALESALSAVGLFARAVVLDAAGEVLAMFGEGAPQLCALAVTACGFESLVRVSLEQEEIDLTELEMEGTTLSLVRSASFCVLFEAQRRVYGSRAAQEVRTLLSRMEGAS